MTPHVPAPPLVDPARHHAFCGIAVDALPPDVLVDTIADGVALGRRVVIGHHNLHGLAILREGDEQFRAFFDLVDASFVDGMSLVAVGRLAGAGLDRLDRATVLDWIWLLFERAEREGWRVVHLGSEPETIELARATIDPRHPDLDLICHHGYFDITPGHPENEAILDTVAADAPQVLLVGMGMPRQERWIVENLDRLPNCVVVTVGGIIGYLGEDRATPPRWMGRLGLEWLARLVTEPSRLAHRYLVEPIPLIPTLAKGIVRERRRRR